MIKKVLDSQITGLAPWIVFSLVSGPKRLEESVLLALVAAVAIYGINRLEGDSFKALELSDVIFFIGLAVVVAFARPDTHQWLETWSDEVSNVALVLIAVGSIVVSKPFTLPYARDRVDPARWHDADFIHTNYVLAGAWAVAFAVAAAAGAYGDGVLHDSDNVWTGWIIQTVALIWAARFTQWYSARAALIDRRQAGLEADDPPAIGELVKSFLGLTSIGTIFHTGGGRSDQ